METQDKELNVKALCSRKLLDLLKNDEYETKTELLAIRSELLARQHYVEQVAEIEQKLHLLAPSTNSIH